MNAATLDNVTLDSFFRHFKNIRLATAKDQTALSAFHQSAVMRSGSVCLAYDFAGQPQRAADEAGDPTRVALFEQAGTLYGTASLSARSARLDGESVSYGYLGNLRIDQKMPRELRREWRQFYGHLVRHAKVVPAFLKPAFLLTAILDENQTALRFLTQHLKTVRYWPLQHYTAVTALAPKPFRRLRVDGVTIRFARHSDFESVKTFLSLCSSTRRCSEAYETNRPGALEWCLTRWNDFAIEQFVVAEREGEVLAVVAPRLTPHRRLRIHVAPAVLRAALAAARLVGMPKANIPGPLNLLHLTHLELLPSLDIATKTKLFDAVLTFVFERVVRPMKAHGMTWATWPQFDTSTSAPGWLSVRSAGTLFEVTTPEATVSPSLLAAAQHGPLPFDLSIS